MNTIEETKLLSVIQAIEVWAIEPPRELPESTEDFTEWFDRIRSAECQLLPLQIGSHVESYAWERLTVLQAMPPCIASREKPADPEGGFDPDFKPDGDWTQFTSFIFAVFRKLNEDVFDHWMLDFLPADKRKQISRGLISKIEILSKLTKILIGHSEEHANGGIPSQGDCDKLDFAYTTIHYDIATDIENTVKECLSSLKHQIESHVRDGQLLKLGRATAKGLTTVNANKAAKTKANKDAAIAELQKRYATLPRGKMEILRGMAREEDNGVPRWQPLETLKGYCEEIKLERPKRSASKKNK